MDIIWHMDEPTAGQSYSSIFRSEGGSASVKVVLGGQGADELFLGYTRYLAALLGSDLVAAIHGTSNTQQLGLEKLAPNLAPLKGYEPMLAQGAIFGCGF